MASGQGSRSSTKKSTGKKGTSGRNARGAAGKGKNTSAGRAARQSEPMDVAIKHEVMLIAVFALAVFLFLCNFGIVGVTGNLVSDVMFGILGLTSYAAPILFFLAVAFGISNKGNSIAVRKLVAAVILFLLVGMGCDLMTGAWSTNSLYSAKALYERCSRDHNGGGLVGGTLAFLSYHFLSMVGTALLIIVLAVICLVIITEKSVMNGVKSRGQRVYERTREDAYNRRERAQRRREEQERLRRDREEERRIKEEAKEDEKILRMDKRVSGVMLDTTLTVKDGKESKTRLRDDMHEIVLTDLDESDFQEEEVVAERSGEEEMLPDLSRIHITSAYQAAEEEIAAEEQTLPAGSLGGNGFGKSAGNGEFGIGQIGQEEGRWNRSGEAGQVMDFSGRAQETGQATAFSDREETAGQAMAFSDREETAGQATAFSDREGTAGQAMAFSDRTEEEGRGNVTSDARQEMSPGGTERVRPAARPAVKEGMGDGKAREAEQGIRKAQTAVPKKYIFPSLNLLKKGAGAGNGDSAIQLKQTAIHLQKTLATFGVRVTITDISQGPTVTRYELQPEQGVKVSKIVGLADDIKLNLAATDIRIEAPIPGKAAVGIEVPNKENSVVALRELLESKEFRDFSSNLAFAVGKDIGGKTVVADIARMPHMLIAGSTGSGKSVCINTLIMSILYKAHPDDVKLIMVDPKVVELSVYNGIPHLMIPVVTDPKKAAAALHWGVAEMTERYKKFADFNVRDLKGYNKAVEAMKGRGEDAPAKMPQIVIIVDELADLMMVSPGEVEESICRLAQLARAAGIHLVIATQRPSVDVITGLIKANMPSRVAFAVSSSVDSRTILDMNGAEKLLGKGDMLFYPQGYPKPARVQGAFVSDSEVSEVVDFLKNQAIGNVYSEDVEAQIKTMGTASPQGGGSEGSSFDQYFAEAGKFIIDKDKASIGMLQRVFKIGFNRAARIMDQLCEAGVVGEEEGTKPRKVLMSMEEFEQLIEESV